MKRQTVADAERRGSIPPRKLASELSGEGQVQLVMDRIGRSVCVECGGKKEPGRGDFCGACLEGYPKVLEAGEGGERLAVNAWHFVVVQRGPAIPGLGLFVAEKRGIYERERSGSALIAYCDTLPQAQEAARKSWNRSMSATAGGLL